MHFLLRATSPSKVTMTLPKTVVNWLIHLTNDDVLATRVQTKICHRNINHMTHQMIYFLHHYHHQLAAPSVAIVVVMALLKRRRNVIQYAMMLQLSKTPYSQGTWGKKCIMLPQRQLSYDCGDEYDTIVCYTLS